MTSRANKVQANMDASVMKSCQLALDFQLLLKVAFKLRINIIHLFNMNSLNMVLKNSKTENNFKTYNRLEGFFFINLVSISNSVNQSELVWEIENIINSIQIKQEYLFQQYLQLDIRLLQFIGVRF